MITITSALIKRISPVVLLGSVIAFVTAALDGTGEESLAVGRTDGAEGLTGGGFELTDGTLPGSD